MNKSQTIVFSLIIGLLAIAVVLLIILIYKPVVSSFGNSGATTMERRTVLGTSSSSPTSINGSASSTVVFPVGSDFTQLDLGVVADVSTTESINIKVQYSVDNRCASIPNNVIWFGRDITGDTTSTSNTIANNQSLTMTNDGNYKFAVSDRLAAECIKLTIGNNTTTVTSTAFIQAIMRNK